MMSNRQAKTLKPTEVASLHIRRVATQTTSLTEFNLITRKVNFNCVMLRCAALWSAMQLLHSQCTSTILPAAT